MRNCGRALKEPFQRSDDQKALVKCPCPSAFPAPQVCCLGLTGTTHRPTKPHAQRPARTPAREQTQSKACAHTPDTEVKEVWPRALAVPQRREMRYTRIPQFILKAIIKWNSPINVCGLGTGKQKSTKTKNMVPNIEGRFPLYGDSDSGYEILMPVSV